MSYQHLYAQTGCIVTEAIARIAEVYFKGIETVPVRSPTEVDIKFETDESII